MGKRARPLSIAVIVSAKGESPRLFPTLRSLEFSARKAGSGIHWVGLVLQDGYSPAKRDRRAGDGIIPWRWSSRRPAGTLPQADLVCHAQAGDLVSSNWFLEVARFARAHGRADLVIHPEAQLTVSGPPVFVRSPQSGSDLALDDLLWGDPWSSLFCAGREVFARIPRVEAAPGFGQATRRWQCETVAAGIRHVSLPRTAHFVRPVPGREDGPRAPDWRDPPMEPSSLLRSPRKFAGPLARAADPGPVSVPGWVVDAWKEAHQFDPLLYPRAPQLANVRSSPRMDPRMTPLYVRMREDLGPDPDTVIVMHQLRRGGSEIEALHHVQAIRRASPKSRIAIVLTEFAQADWAPRLPEGVRIVEFGKLTEQYLDAEQRCALLSALLLHAAPRVIHVKHSREGWEVLKVHGRALAARSRLYASFYCMDYNEQGIRQSYAFTHLPEAYPHLAGVFCDNRFFCEQIRELYGFEIVPIYYPAPAWPARGPQVRRGAGPLRILWASRICRQKQIDVLRELARRFPGDEFHVWGEMYLDQFTVAADLFASRPNVIYHGAFDSFAGLPTHEFDLFLYTSAWDGMPNVLLEAASVGLPIVAPAVGGIPELLTDRTGYLVHAREDYARAIDAVRADAAEAARRALRMRRLLGRRHSFPAFFAQLRRQAGYLGASR